ncbi:MAG: caa(3)-type oxidase, subunit [Planctomycetaceae bacterium]|nr:caa(3)-type oxidase, subunit [Planctomycetaceae bacterium]
MTHPSPALRVYGIVYVALMLLLALTVEAARHDLGHANFAVAVLIAAIKAFLIALYFMHVRNSTSLIKLVVAAGLLWLCILFSLSLSDYWTREWL